MKRLSIWFYSLIEFDIYICTVLIVSFVYVYAADESHLVDKDISQYSKTCVKRPLKIRQNKVLNDKW